MYYFKYYHKLAACIVLNKINFAVVVNAESQKQVLSVISFSS